MSLACLVCPGVERSPSTSFRSFSVSSSDNDGRCTAMAGCLSGKLSVPPTRGNSLMPSSKVFPRPDISGTPRLVRSRAVRRDQVSEWNFDEIER